MADNTVQSFIDSYDLKHVDSDVLPETTVEELEDTGNYVDEWPVDTERDTSLARDENIEQIGTISEQLENQIEGYKKEDFSHLEVTSTLLSGFTGMIASGVLGAGTVFAQAAKNVIGAEMTEDDIRKYDPIDVMTTVQDAMIYRPTSDLAKEITETIAVPGHWWHENVATTIGDIGYYVSDYVGGRITKDALDPDIRKKARGYQKELSSTVSGMLTAAADIAMPFYIINKAIKPILNTSKSLPKTLKKVRDNAIDEYIYNEFESISAVKKRHSELRNLEDKIEGYEAGVVELTESPGLASVQRELASKVPQRKLLNAQRIKNNRRAIVKFMNDTVGTVFKDDKVVMTQLDKILTESKGSVDAAIDYLIKLSESNIEKQSALSRSLAKTGKEETGANLRRTMDRGYRINKLIGKMNYDRVGNPTVNADSFVSSFIKESSAPAFKALVDVRSEAVPSIYYEIMGVIKNATEKASVIGKDGKPVKVAPIELEFTQLKDWDQTLNRTIRTLERKQDVGRELYFTRKAKTYVNDAMDSLLGEGGKTATSYRFAKDYWGKNVVDKFETGIVGEILKTNIKGKNGVYKVIDEKVIDTIFSKGTKTAGGGRAITDFLKIFGDHPVAMMQLKEGIYRKLKDYADPKNTGLLDDAKVEQFIFENDGILKYLPEWKKDFSEINRINHGLAVSTRRANSHKQLLENHELTKALGGENPFKMIGTALKSPEAMRELMVRLSNNPHAKEALSRAVSHYIFGKAIIKDKRGIWHVDHVKANKILDAPEHAKSLNMLYGDGKHMANMKVIVKAWESQSPYRMIAEERVSPTGLSFEKAFEQNVGTSLKSMMGDVRLIGVRHVPPQYIAGGWIIRKISSFRTAVLEESIAKSFFDKELATIVKEVIDMEKTAQARSKHTSSSVKSDLLRLKAVEKKLREHMIKTGDFGFDATIAGAQAIANVGRIEGMAKEPEPEPPQLRVQ